MRAELAQPGQQMLDSNTFNGLLSVHAALMIFLVVIPIFAGLANYVIPLMIGAPDMAFPRLNALSYWLLPVAGVMMTASFLVPDGGAFNKGWTAYAPLSTDAPLGQEFFNIGVQFAGVVDHDRAQLPGHDHHDARPGNDLLADAAACLGQLHDVSAGRARHTVHRRIAVPGDVRPRDPHELLHCGRGRLSARVPAHLLVLLAPGRLHHDPTRVRNRLRGHLGLRSQADLRLSPDGLSLLAILLLGFSVWAHHMFVSGMAPWLRDPDDGDDAADRGAHRDQGVLVVGHDVGGPHPLHHTDVMGGRLRRDVP